MARLRDGILYYVIICILSNLLNYVMTILMFKAIIAFFLLIYKVLLKFINEKSGRRRKPFFHNLLSHKYKETMYFKGKGWGPGAVVKTACLESRDSNSTLAFKV